ncbi:NADH-quinone oxidoreductase subunit L [Opitutaceae bacterium TAV4]|nr:NADH-quinone oxidoreductase subunit L [Opitutaceae bacterium TAV4]RRK01911.1 NADH-quinone oxidoreductase subunit L [Opitutaceae bacterium TAV3]
MPTLVPHLWLIPALPLAACVIGVFTSARSRLASTAALAAMAAAFVVSCLSLREALASPAAHATATLDWINAGALTLPLSLLLDPLTAFMLVMVTFVGFLIFLFSTGYMKDDPRYGKFFCYLSLFAAAMLGLLISNSLLLLFVCWELVGLASYLLIGFWFEKPSAAAAAKKAFIVTRIGDLGFLLGILWLHSATDTLLFYANGAGFLETTQLGSLAALALPGGLAISTAIGLLIFCGAIGKSGQFPLHVWLPDAMEGPTPVSALIHAATMVAAGVFLMARIQPLLTPDALAAIATIGAITALFGAILATAQNDIKRILAYSTVSQLGYMMLAIGVGAWPAAIFHLLTHAFFKALLFLGAGSVIHAAHHEQDIRNLGGLAPRMKLTFATFAIGMMALAGVPFVFSGFWSKEAILHGAHAWPISQLPFFAALAAVILTAFYMTRLVAEVFLGRPRTHAAEHAHENPLSMTLPLALLAICAIALGFLGTPAWPWLQAMLEGRAEVHGHGIFDEGTGLMLTSIALVAIGIGSGLAIYARRSRIQRGHDNATAPDPVERVAPGLFNAFAHRLYIDELYAATVGRLTTIVAALSDFADRWIWGGVIRALAGLACFTGGVTRDTDEVNINGSFDATTDALRTTARAYSRTQTGDARVSLTGLALGFVALIVVTLILGGVL